jgi:hypothetical protein
MRRPARRQAGGEKGVSSPGKKCQFLAVRSRLRNENRAFSDPARADFS